MKKIFKIFLIIIVVASVGYLGFVMVDSASESDEVIATDSLFVTDIAKKAVASGIITPRKEVSIKSVVSGVVDKLYVEAGEQVKAGDKIAKIRIIPNVVQLNSAVGQVDNARINYDNARKEYERQHSLFEEKVISEYEFNRFKLDYNLSKQSLEAAESNLELIKEGASKRSGTASNIVRSTVDGMVLDVPVKEGNFVIESNTFNDGTTVAEVADMAKLIFEGNIDEADVGKLHEGMEMLLDIGALEGDSLTAKLEFIAPKGKEDLGAIKFQLKAEVVMVEGQVLRAGYSANASLELERKNDVLALREKNIFFEEGKTYVNIQTDDNKFEKKEVKTGISDGINVEILSGLTKDDLVKEI